MTSRALISKIHCTLSSNRKEIASSMYNNSRCLLFTVCPSGITNITASSGILAYPSSGDYGINETKCWGIEVPDTYLGI